MAVQTMTLTGKPGAGGNQGSLEMKVPPFGQDRGPGSGILPFRHLISAGGRGVLADVCRCPRLRYPRRARVLAAVNDPNPGTSGPSETRRNHP